MLKTRSNSETDFFLNPIATHCTSDLQESINNSQECKENLFEEFMNLYNSLSIDTCIALKSFLVSASLWDILDSIPDYQFNLVNPSLITSYFSITDKVASICKLESDEFFFPRNFSAFTESTLSVKLDQNDMNLKRYINALENLNNYGLNILSKDPKFWDSLNRELLASLTQYSKIKFLYSMYSALLNKKVDFRTLVKLFCKIENNLDVSTEELGIVIFEFAVSKGLFDYRELATFLSCISFSHKNGNEFISNITLKILKHWSNDSWIFRNSFSTQLHYSSCLVLALSFLSPDLFTKDMEELLMNGVQSRLDHSDYQIRLLGTIIAEKLNNFQINTEAKLDFGLDPKNEIVSHLYELSILTQSIIFPESIKVSRDSETSVHMPVQYGTATIVEIESEDEEDVSDLEPISSLLRENINPPKNSKKQLPRFLPDCIKLLRDNDDAELVSTVLKKLPEIYMSSSGLARQLHSVSAFNVVILMSDHYETKDFDEMRRTAMECVFIDQIEYVSSSVITDMFHSNKLVLSQKLELMQVVCSSAQEIFCGSSNTLPQKRLINNSALDYYEKSFLISESKIANRGERHKVKSINAFIDNLCVPILVQSIRHFQHFQRNHAMFLEKFLWLQAIFLNYSQNHINYDRLVEKYFDFVHLCLRSPPSSTISGAFVTLIDQIPIQKGILLGLSVALSSWPAGLSLLQFYPKMKEIYGFLETVSNGPGFGGDERLQALGSSVALALQDLTDPQKLLRESSESLSFDMKEMKISHLRGT